MSVCIILLHNLSIHDQHGCIAHAILNNGLYAVFRFQIYFKCLCYFPLIMERISFFEFIRYVVAAVMQKKLKKGL